MDKKIPANMMAGIEVSKAVFERRSLEHEVDSILCLKLASVGALSVVCNGMLRALCATVPRRRAR